MASTTALPELETRDLDDLDAGLAHLGDREGVALIAHDDARFFRVIVWWPARGSEPGCWAPIPSGRMRVATYARLAALHLHRRRRA